MDRMPDDQPPSLRNEPSTLSDYSVDSNSTYVGSPLSPIQHRASYRRVPSFGGAILPNKSEAPSSREAEDAGESSNARGLGIQNVLGARQASFRRGHVASDSDSGTPKSADPLLSPPSAQLGRPHSQKSDFETQDENYEFLYSQFSTPSLPQPFLADSEYESLHKKIATGSVGLNDSPGMHLRQYQRGNALLPTFRHCVFRYIVDLLQ